MAEHVKSDKGAELWNTILRIWNSWQKIDFEVHCDGWTQIRKSCFKSENSQTGESRKIRDEEKLCKSIITGQARRNREKHMTLAPEEEVQHVFCIDDVTSKELPWHGVRKDHGKDFFFFFCVTSRSV